MTGRRSRGRRPAAQGQGRPALAGEARRRHRARGARRRLTASRAGKEGEALGGPKPHEASDVEPIDWFVLGLLVVGVVAAALAIWVTA